jgi:hypothetical protein
VKTMRGQAAIEYLMTYGWAILVIAIVIAVLYMFFTPYLSVNQCTMETGFACNDPLPEIYIGADGNVQMNIRIHNKQQEGIIIKAVLCTTAPPEQVQYSTTYNLPKEVTIPAGGYGDVTKIECLNENGNPVQMQAGQNFKGNIIIWYQTSKQIDKTLLRETRGTIMGNIMTTPN